MKAEAVLHASRGVDVGVIAGMVERAERTVREWPAEWRGTRMRRVPAGHAGNRDAVEPARARKQEPKAVLARPPSRTGARAGFRDAPALREVVKILFDAEHQSDSSHRLLPPLCGPSLEPPDPFDGHRDETATTRRAAWATTRVKALLDAGWKVYTADEARPEHEAWTRRMQPPKGQRTRPVRGPAEDVPVLPRRPPPTSRTVTPYPIEQNQNTWQTTLAPDLLQRETEAGKTAVVPDNARPHHARALTGLHEPGRLLERITTIFLPPYVPDHQPGRARTERGQERHRHHPARDPRRNPRSIRPTRHRTHRRPRLRTPPAPRNQKRSCSMTAIDYQRLRGHLLSTEPSASFGLVGHTAVAVVGQPQAGIVLAAACRHLGAALRLDAISRSVPDAVVEESVVSDETRLPEAFLRVDADLAALAAEQMCLALGFAKRSLPGADQAVLKFTRLVAPRLYEIIGVSP